MRWSIRYQLLVPLVTLLLGVLGVSGWAALAAAGRARQQIEDQVRDVARTLGGSNFPLTANVLEQMKGLSGAEYVLVRPDGRRVATFGADATDLPPPESLADDWQTLRLGPPLAVGEHAYLCGGVRLRPARADAEGALYILYPEARWRDALRDAVRPSLVAGGVLGLASLALALGLGRRLTRRIQELERRTRQIADGDFGPVPLAGPPDELLALGRSVNEMAQRLAQLQEAARSSERLRLLGQVSGGLAHQLRNGVTGARLAVQLHARACTSGDAEALDVALRQLALVESNLKRFLDLGRTTELRRAPCSLGAVLSQVVDLYRPQCQHAHIDLRWEPPAEDVSLEADAGRLEHLFLNLLSNAVEAAGPGGRVTIAMRKAARAEEMKESWKESVTHSASASSLRTPYSVLRTPCASPVAVEISDSGPGPPPDLAERLFEPFVTGKPEGVGLGLAVARQSAEAQGGRITWRREDGRTVFRVELPLEQDREPHSSGG